MQTKQESLGLFEAVGIIMHGTVQVVAGTVNAVLPAVKSVENVTEAAQFHTAVIRTKAEQEHVVAMDALMELKTEPKD